MTRILLICLFVVIIVSGLVAIRFFRPATSNNNPVVKTNSEISNSSSGTPPRDLNLVSTEDRVKLLEDTVAALSKKVGGVGNVNKPADNSSDFDTRLKALEASIADLKRVNNLPQNIVLPTQAPVAQTSSPKTPAYIPLGSGGSTTGTNWYSMDSYQISLDPADYSGYSSVQLELTGKLIEQVGNGSVRLWNQTDNAAVASSDTATITSTQSTLVTSGSFKLASGRKTYQLQAKSDKGYEFYLQNARLKVSF